MQEHNDKTTAKHEASLAAIEEEIKTAKASFEEDLLKIESKMSQNPDSLMRDEDLIHEDDEENEETENKPRSALIFLDRQCLARVCMGVIRGFCDLS